MHFDLDARVFVLSNWHKIQLCEKLSSVIFICVSVIVWTNRPHNVDEGICFPDNCCYENG